MSGPKIALSQFERLKSRKLQFESKVMKFITHESFLIDSAQAKNQGHENEFIDSKFFASNCLAPSRFHYLRKISDQVVLGHYSHASSVNDTAAESV